MKYNERICRVEPSKSVTLLAKTKELQKTDRSIINLTGGEPDFATPEPVCQEAARQLAAGNTHYSDSRGDEELRIRIAQKLQEEKPCALPAGSDPGDAGGEDGGVPDSPGAAECGG